MCGIVGMAGALTYADKDVFRTMMILSTLRGEDSAGVAAIPRKGGEPNIVKSVGTSFDLFAMSAYDRIVASNSQALIGHTRKKTIGDISKYTAHPFYYQHLAGVHNGTLRNWKDLNGTTLATDSMTLYQAMAADGVRETIEETEGAYALVWYNEEENTVNFLRNKERPLYYAFNKDFTKIYWASEPMYIFRAVGVSNLADISAKDADIAVYCSSVEEDVWFSIRINAEYNSKSVITYVKQEPLIGGIRKPAKARPFHTPTSTQQARLRSPFEWEGDANNPELNDEVPLLGTPPATTSTAAGSTTTAASGQPSPATTSVSPATPAPRPTLTLVPSTKSGGSEQSVVAEPTIVGYNGTLYNIYDFDKTDGCCSFCQRDIEWEGARAGMIGKWLSEEAYLCTPCFRQAE